RVSSAPRLDYPRFGRGGPASTGRATRSYTTLFRSADDPEAEKAGVELMVSTEASIDPGGPLVSTVTVTNHGDDALSAGSVSLEVDRKSTRLNSSHVKTSYAVFCVKKKKTHSQTVRT